jgi:hypothetical protein
MSRIPYIPNLTTERGRHLHWCKTRAFEYLDAGDIKNAWLSFASDMGKLDATAQHAALNPLLATMYMDSVNNMRLFIEGFN